MKAETKQEMVKLERFCFSPKTDIKLNMSFILNF